MSDLFNNSSINFQSSDKKIPILKGNDILSKNNNNLNSSSNNVEEMCLEDFLIDDSIPKGYSVNNYSDKSNIYINRLSNLMTKFRHNLGEENYSIFSQYITGLKLSDIIDSNGNLITLTNKDKMLEVLSSMGIEKNPEQVIEDINKILNSSDISLSNMDEEMLDSTITEVVDGQYGYDAMVLKNTEGNYLIVNSCTDAKSTDDIYALAYVLSKQVVGDDELVEMVIDQILPAVNISGIKDSDYYLDLVNNGGVDYLKEAYEGQLNENIKLIEKYIDKAQKEGNKIQLNGYSLGGGTQLTTYSILCSQNPEFEKYIESVSVYNPFVSYLEQNPANITEESWFTSVINTIKNAQTDKEPLVSYIANSDKVRIYSGEEDYISTFNNCLYELKDKYVYVKTEDIGKREINNITELYSLIIGDKANHNFSSIEEEYFDEQGNIKEVGSYVSIADSYSKAIDNIGFLDPIIRAIKDKLNLTPERKKYEVDYNTIVENTLDLSAIEAGISLFAPELEGLFDELSRYLRKNVGHYSYNGIANALVDGAWESFDGVVEDVINKFVKNQLPKLISENISPSVSDFIAPYLSELAPVAENYVKEILSEESFKKSLVNFLESEENKEYVISALNSLNNGDYLRLSGQIDSLVNNFEESFELGYEDVGKESIGILFFEIGYTDVIERAINMQVKEIIVNTLNDFVISQKSKAIKGYLEENPINIKEKLDDVNLGDLFKKDKE